MTSSTSCSSKVALAFLALAVSVACAGSRAAAPSPGAARAAVMGADSAVPRAEPEKPRERPRLAGRRIAVLPIENLSGGVVPGKHLLKLLSLAAARAGADVVEGNPVDEFLSRHRVRFTGGIDAATASAARDELEVDAVLVTSVLLYHAGAPPKIAVTMRLVATGERPEILWMDGAVLSGNDEPGLLDLGIISKIERLERNALARLTGSLAGFLSGQGSPVTTCPAERRFEPRVSFRSRRFAPGAASVAVLPFVNQTERRGAGEALAVEFVRHLSSLGTVTVAEPGVVRDALIRYRIVLEGSLSLLAVRTATEVLGTDLVLTGVVREYDDVGPVPKADFTVTLIDTRTEEVVWEATSDHRGDDDVVLFDRGRVNTATALACRMVRSVVDGIAAATKPGPRDRSPALERRTVERPPHEQRAVGAVRREPHEG
ncbi:MULTISPECIES: hypothetical protein [unclassified Anaeromyxobacter]|uniref:hypothetical protein n=1 Tax=unclassified Anaeromyxobacter TaxID=2620896 RepID=UPI001F5771B6|nr:MULTISPECIES: hypothetical protein [unclassified Anaeromyxobacter]